MAEPLKNIYNETFFKHFSGHMRSVYPPFDAVAYQGAILDEYWEDRALKDRMHLLAATLRPHLPSPFPEAVSILVKLVQQLQKHPDGMALEYMFLPDFIEQFGLDDYDTSIAAFEIITQYSSCEFAVRPFIVKYQEKMMVQMARWAKHPEHTVRRLASEGCRPRLPWAMALNDLKKDPSPIFPILEQLKTDSSLFVRKSVANNLNDISKDHPALILKRIKNWKGQSKDIDWIIKHGSRSLLKQGNAEALALFGLGSTEGLQVDQLDIINPVVRIGDSLEFQFNVLNGNGRPILIRLEYGVYYRKANGSLSRKVFKISEKSYPPYSKTRIKRKQSFRPISTRVHYQGQHALAIILNGKEFEKQFFEVSN